MTPSTGRISISSGSAPESDPEPRIDAMGSGSLLLEAQRWMFARVLAAMHTPAAGVAAAPMLGAHHVEVDFDLWAWATGRDPYPNLATVTWPA